MLLGKLFFIPQRDLGPPILWNAFGDSSNPLIAEMQNYKWDSNEDVLKDRKVYWKYRVSGKRVLIEENLTRAQAMRMVQQNQKTNPSIKVKMMQFGKM